MKADQSLPSKSVEVLARYGYACKGVIYGLVGLLALMAGLNLGGDTLGAAGVVEFVSMRPFGRTLIIALGAGLAGHVLWRVLQATVDAEKRGRGLRGIITRLGLLGSALFYSALVANIYVLLTRAYQADSQSALHRRLTELLAYESGFALIMAAGLVFVGVGLHQAGRSYRQSFVDHWDSDRMTSAQQHAATAIAHIGLLSRGIVFVIIGVLLALAGLESNARRAVDLEGALEIIAHQTYGRWLLVVVAVGFVCYAVYCFVNARRRHIRPW